MLFYFQHAVLGQWCLAQQQSADTESDTSTCHFQLFLGRVTFSLILILILIIAFILMLILIIVTLGKSEHSTTARGKKESVECSGP